MHVYRKILNLYLGLCVPSSGCADNQREINYVKNLKLQEKSERIDFGYEIPVSSPIFLPIYLS